MTNLDQPNVLLCTVDSLRADRVTEETMPTLASLADEGVSFTDIVSTAPATAASFVGLIASRYYADVEGIGLPDEEFTTIAEALPEAYSTIGYSTNQFTSSYYNYDRGFDQFTGESQGIKFKVRKTLNEDGSLFQALEWGYQQYLTLTSDTDAGAPSYFNTPAETVNQQIADSVAAEDGPTFAWAHHMDPHHPYEPPEPYLPESVEDRGQAQRLSRELPGLVPEDRSDDLDRCIDLYDVECQYWDEEFSALLDEMPDNTLTIVVGDHGELLGEHDRLGHPHEMWEELVRVPLIIHHPDLPSETIQSQQSTIALAPTILDLLGVDTPADMRGSPIDLNQTEPRERAFGTIETPDHVGMVRTPSRKWVRHQSRRPSQTPHDDMLFEHDDESVRAGIEHASEESSITSQLGRAFDREMQSSAQAEGRRATDSQVKRHLADLGYAEEGYHEGEDGRMVRS